MNTNSFIFHIKTEDIYKETLQKVLKQDLTLQIMKLDTMTLQTTNKRKE